MGWAQSLGTEPLLQQLQLQLYYNSLVPQDC